MAGKESRGLSGWVLYIMWWIYHFILKEMESHSSEMHWKCYSELRAICRRAKSDAGTRIYAFLVLMRGTECGHNYDCGKFQPYLRSRLYNTWVREVRNGEDSRVTLRSLAWNWLNVPYLEIRHKVVNFYNMLSLRCSWDIQMEILRRKYIWFWRKDKRSWLET